jgi:hypothetical protein
MRRPKDVPWNAAYSGIDEFLALAQSKAELREIIAILLMYREQQKEDMLLDL